MNPFAFTIITLFTSIQFCVGQNTSLKVGGMAPDLTVHSWIKGEPISTFKKGRIYVLEFGATWCVPCAKAIPELTRVATEYKDNVSVASLFVMERSEEPSATQKPDYVARVERYVQKRASSIAYAVGIDTQDKLLVKTWLTPLGYRGIPVVCVINQQGQLAWTGTNVAAAIPTIKALIKNGTNTTSPIAPEPTNTSTSATVQLDSVLFSSRLSPYKKRGNTPSSPYISGYHWVRGIPELESVLDNVNAIGRPIDQLYYLAYSDTLSNMVPFRNVKNEFPDTISKPYLNSSYGKYWFRTLVEVADRTPFEVSKNSIANRYNYTLEVPTGHGSAALMQHAMRNDLDTYFGYNVVVETRLMPCWNLVISDKQRVTQHLFSKLPSKSFFSDNEDHHFTFKNASMRDLIAMLGSTYGYGTLDYGRLPLKDQAPFIDATGITNAIDFTFDKGLTFSETLKALNAIGLDIVKSERHMKVVVLRN
ncbi:MAG: TlpA family protein disulfide reductase [Cytophagales bacterium]|nr:TlpA family protein disulfide reductase [Cytophagales bacterium]